MNAPVNPPTTGLVICASSAVARAGLAALAEPPSEEIASAPSTQIMGETSSLRSLTLWLQTQTASLAIVDLSSIREGDLDELTQMTETLPLEESLPLLLLIDSSLENSFFVRLLDTQLLSTGLVSLLPMTVSAGQVRGAIAAITQGLTVIHPEIAEALFDSTTYRLAASESHLEHRLDNTLEPLTTRELEVLNWLANGITNKEIARALTISEHTVKFHISAILSKLNVSSRTEAVAVGIRTGLVML